MSTDPVVATLKELAKEGRAIVEGAEEALRHYQEGDHSAARMVASLTHNKISSASTVWSSAMEYFEAAGIRPLGDVGVNFKKRSTPDK